MLDFIKELAWESGEICLKASAPDAERTVEFKGNRDLVTQIDKEVEDFLVSRIEDRFPDHSIIGEETGRKSASQNHCWIIDPIDGTTSFVHRQPYYSVSIAYQEKGKTRAGVVYAPALGQLFSAVKGDGAYLNGSEKLTVSSTDTFINSLWATGFACLRAGKKINNVHYLSELLPHMRDIRRCGSAAIDLAYVAAGKVDGFWEMDLNDYDVAAGILLVEEAGGLICDLKGGQNYPDSGVLATNKRLQPDFLHRMRDIERKLYPEK